jgi:hypothetical protein
LASRRTVGHCGHGGQCRLDRGEGFGGDEMVCTKVSSLQQTVNMDCDSDHEQAPRSLGSVGIQREFMTAAAILIMAAKL